MEFEDLKKLVLTADQTALCEALAPLTEAERAALFPDAMELHKSIEKDFGPSMSKQDLKKHGYTDWRCPRWAGSLMMLAVADDKFMKAPYKFDCGWVGSDLRDMPRQMLQILDARRPNWLAAYIQRESREEIAGVAWTVEYGLIRSGALPRNESEAFYKRMALEYSILRDGTKDDQEFLNNYIWKLFDYDAGAFNYSHSPWFEAFKSLSDKGAIDRNRLLNVTAAALSRPSRPKELAGYGKLHENLAPTVEEREPLIGHYLAALNSEHSAVVGCGLAALEKLIKAKKLDGEQFLRHCDNVMSLPKKAQAVKCIKLIKTLVKQQAELAGQASEVLTIALTHERPDVQETALKELEALTDSFTDETRRLLEASADNVASVLKSRVTALLESVAKAADDRTGQSATGRATDAKKSSGTKTSAKKKVAKPSSAAEVKALRARLAKIDELTKQDTQAARAVEEIGDAREPFVANLRPGDVPRRDPSREVRAIESLEELIDTVATVIERVDDAIDIERIIDGIACFGQERPKDFETRVSPLRKRIKKLDEPYSQTVIDLGAKIGFSQLLAEWLQMEPIHRDSDSWRDLDGSLFRKRCKEIAAPGRETGKATGLLALPSHDAGWLDPNVLVHRVSDHFLKTRRVIDDADLTQAMLRLMPDGRTEAMARLAQAVGDNDSHGLYSGGNDLRYALGEGTELSGGPDYTSTWQRHSAAIHARLLIEPDDFKPPFPVASGSTNDDFTIRVDGPFTDDPSLPDRLCLLAYSRSNSGLPDARETTWMHQLEAIVWPSNPQPMFMLGHIDPIFDHDLTWTREGARVILTASTAESKELRLLATDALIDGFGQVRACPKLVGRQLHGLGDFLTLKRSAEVLTSVGQVSELHHRAVFYTIDEFVSQLHITPKDLHFALTPMLESALQSGESISASCRRLLESIKGSSKTAKLARQLLSVEVDPAKQMTASLQAANAAVERAERWAVLQG